MTWFTDGGPFMYFILIHALTGVVWVIWRTKKRHWRSWFDVWVAWCASLLSLGTLGTTLGLILTLKAVSTAAPASKTALLTTGTQLAYTPLAQSVFWCVVLLALAGSLQWRTAPIVEDGWQPSHHGLQWLTVLALGTMGALPVLGLLGFHGSLAAMAQGGGALPLQATVNSPFYAAGTAMITIVAATLYAPARWMICLDHCISEQS